MTAPLPLIVDCFAGGGGASTGIELALNRSPDAAINHSAAALALHAANHPETLHIDSNIWDVDPRSVTQGQQLGLLWASPDCKHFSKAKGSAPKDRNIRDLAWNIVRWMEEARPDVVIMENVEEFRTWGPIYNDGQPIREFMGQTFDDWTRRIRRAGYRLQWRELRACDFGAPTIRKRFFMVARRDGRPIVWPRATHGDPKSPAVRQGRLKPWRTAGDCIDWTQPCPSIFDTAAQVLERYGRRAIRPLAPNTLARVARGIGRYVLQSERPFIVNLTHGARTEDLAEPLRTVTGAHRGEKALVTPCLASIAHGDSGGWREYAMTDPLGTVTVGGIQHALIAPTLAQVGYGERLGQLPRALDLAAPLGTVVAGGGKHALVAPHLLALKGTARRAQAVTAPHPTVLAGGGHSALISAVLTYAQQGGGTRDARDPHHTICASRKDQNQVAAAFLAQHNTGVTARPLDAPMSTVCQSGSHQNVVASWFAKYYGTGDGSRTDEPLHTVTVKDRMGHCQATLHAPPYGPEHYDRARQVADLLRAHGQWDGGDIVTLQIDSQTFVIVDIGMRMLTPRELFNAQGFPPDYVIEGVWQDTDTDNPTFRPFPNDVQVSCCGNSVCPPLAEAIVRANCAHLAATRQEVAA